VVRKNFVTSGPLNAKSEAEWHPSLCQRVSGDDVSIERERTVTMTGAERVRALRERRRRGLRQLSVEVHEDELGRLPGRATRKRR
jgi:hypothetical protein